MTELEVKILDLKRKGMSYRGIAGLTGIAKSTVFDIHTRLLKEIQQSVDESPKILILDIETAPTKAWTWRRFKENIGQSQVIQEGYVLTWAAKWLGDAHISGDSLHFYLNALKEENDKPLIESMFKMLSEADIVVAHNGDRFDLTTLNTRMLFHGFKPPKPYKTVDTLKILKKHFRFPSNSLNSVCEYLGIGEKVDTGGFELWARCMNGEAEAFEEMLHYNTHDVELLEELYNKIAPWYTTHPNVANMANSGKAACTVCHSNDLKKDGVVHTAVSTFQAYQCNACGHWSRGRSNLKSKEEMTATLTNVSGGI